MVSQMLCWGYVLIEIELFRDRARWPLWFDWVAHYNGLKYLLKVSINNMPIFPSQHVFNENERSLIVHLLRETVRYGSIGES